VHGCFLGFLWCFQRVFVRAPSGRKRFNVLGALNAVTHELILVTNETYITADSVCALLAKLAQLGLTVPISVVMDNASYQRCAKVLLAAAELGIELVFLPPYSPNLNLIERLWRFVRGECLYGQYYATFKEFKGAIETCLHETGGHHRQALAQLMTLKFQRLGELKL